MTTSQESTKQEFKNEHIRVIASRAPGCRAILEVTVTPQNAAQTYAKALKNVNKEVSLPGFRKGKAPEALVKQHFSKYVEQEWNRLVTDYALQAAIDLSQIHPISRDGVQRADVKSLTLDDGAELRFEMETAPVVPEINLKDMTLTEPHSEGVTEDAIAKAIKNLQLYHAEWIDITDRPAQEGDFVDLTIDTLETPSHNICSNERFELSAKHMPSWMRKLVIGRKPGEQAEGTSVYEEGFTPEVSADKFKPTQLRIILQHVRTAKLPSVDDALAAKAGVKEGVDELRSRIAASLQREADASREQGLLEQLERQLTEKYSFELPHSMLDAEKQLRFGQQVRGMLKQQVSEDAIRHQTDALRERALNQANRFLHLYYLLRPVLEKGNVSITQSELYNELTHQLQSTPTEEQIIHEEMKPEIVRGRLSAMVTIHKGLRHLLDQLRPQHNK